MAATLEDELRPSHAQRVLIGWRSLATAVTPWRVAVWAASSPGYSLDWLAPPRRALHIARNGRAGGRRSFTRRQWCQ